MSDESLAFSLADFADLDISSVEEVRFELIPQGVYVFEVTEADVEENLNKDLHNRFVSGVACKIIEVKSVLQPGVDKDSLVGKTITDRQYMTPPWPELAEAGGKPLEEQKKKFADSVGRLKAFLVDIGVDVSQGKVVDRVNGLVGHTFTAKITHEADREDKTLLRAKLKA